MHRASGHRGACLVARDVEQRRLADAGFARDDHDAAGSGAQLLHRAAEEALVVAASDESSGLDARGPLADDAPRRDRPRLALHRQLPDRFELERTPGQLLRELADVGLAAGRGDLQALRHIDRVAEHRIVGAHLVADDARDCVAGVDPDAQTELLRLSGKGGSDRFEPVVHLERDRKRARSVVLVAGRSAEEREQRVARVLVDVPLVASDDLAQHGHDAVDDLGQRLGIDLPTERGESRDVGEQRRHQPSLLGGPAVARLLGNLAAREPRDQVVDGRGCVQCARGPAMAAEPCPHGIGALARLAPPRHQRRTVMRNPPIGPGFSCPPPGWRSSVRRGRRHGRGSARARRARGRGRGCRPRSSPRGRPSPWCG